MASFIPWHGKKLATLGLRERKLISRLQENAPIKELAKIAEEVRAAQIRAFKAKRSQLAPSEKNARAMNNLDKKISFWVDTPVEKIIEGYRGGRFQRERPARCLRGDW
jgi:hypothetical protein